MDTFTIKWYFSGDLGVPTAHKRGNPLWICRKTSCIGLQEYTEEIERLKRDLYAAREKNGIFLSAENYAGMETKIRTQQELIKELEDKITANLGEIDKVCVNVD